MSGNVLLLHESVDLRLLDLFAPQSEGEVAFIGLRNSSVLPFANNSFHLGFADVFANIPLVQNDLVLTFASFVNTRINT